jgi:hypothetical protein
MESIMRLEDVFTNVIDNTTPEEPYSVTITVNDTSDTEEDYRIQLDKREAPDIVQFHGTPDWDGKKLQLTVGDEAGTLSVEDLYNTVKAYMREDTDGNTITILSGTAGAESFHEVMQGFADWQEGQERDLLFKADTPSTYTADSMWTPGEVVN